MNPTATPRYFEDLQVGQRFVSAERMITKDEIIRFARDYDPQPFHVDEAAAKASFFGELVASGWHTAAIAMRLLVDGELNLAGGLIGGGGEVVWPNPVRPGDTLQVHSELVEARPSKSRPDRGSIVVRSEVRNQRGEPVQIFSARLIVPRRHPAP